MTNSMIPYSFIPGTKAKASEVNANFIAIANKIDANKSACDENINDINEQLEQFDSAKADKTELINEHTVTEYDTDLNDYKTKGTYIFSSSYTPENIPKGASGILIVTGDKDSVIKQVWYCDGENPEIFTRNFSNSEWESWSSAVGTYLLGNPGYIKLPNGLIIQWGGQCGSVVTYPIAFSGLACPLFSKNGWSGTATRSDTGLSIQSMTGFDIGSTGTFYNMNRIAYGF